MIQRSDPAYRISFPMVVCTFALLFLSACVSIAPMPTTAPSTIVPSQSPSLIHPSPTLLLTTLTPTSTTTPGPSPTSTPLPALGTHTWQANPIMVEAAHIGGDPLMPFSYTPFFILYGDGQLVQRSCSVGECRYVQTYLERAALCQLINAIDRSGFLNADPFAFNLLGSTGTVIRLAVQIDKENRVEIPDLDRWIETPAWYADEAGCPNCFNPPSIDPAFVDLYRLLTTYAEQPQTGLNTERLALWITQPVISGAAQPWNEDLVSLKTLVAESYCPQDPDQQQAVILEGSTALAVASFISNQDAPAPIFTNGELTRQVHSRWLLPYEMPQTCGKSAGLYPPSEYQNITWHCEPDIGAIPTPTPTITPSPTITPTPLR